MKEMAINHPTRKFMQIQANKCVENFMDEDVPCLLFYSNGKLLTNIAGKICRDIFLGKRMTYKIVEYVLFKEFNFLEIDFEDDPRDSLKTFNAVIHKKANLGRREEDSD